MTTGAHRKPAEESARLPRIPVAPLVTLAILIILAMAAVVGISALATPTYAHASTGYLSPAMNAAKTVKDLPPSVRAYTQFLEESGGYGLGVNPSALPWF